MLIVLRQDNAISLIIMKLHDFIIIFASFLNHSQEIEFGINFIQTNMLRKLAAIYHASGKIRPDPDLHCKIVTL